MPRRVDVPRMTHKELRKIVGGWAYRALRKGRPLQIWRRSSPHNWFIETSRGGDFLWHSWPGEPRPSLDLFDKISDSDSSILMYWGSDSGMSELSKYRLRVEDEGPVK